jgi:hypothetical protein
MASELAFQYFRQAVLNSIQTTVNEVFNKSQENCPMVTGVLRGSGGISQANPPVGDYTISYNINNSAPYAQIVEEGGFVNSYVRRNSRTGKTHAVKGYGVDGNFFIKNAITDVFSGDYNLTVIQANEGSSGYYINI